MKQFIQYLKQEEKTRATIQKYQRDVTKFLNYVNGQPLTKQIVIDYKQYLIDQQYKVSSINSMLASINAYFKFIEREDLKVKQLKQQKSIYLDEDQNLTRQEYLQLLKVCEKHHKTRLSLIMQTICSSGIRISELPFITVEAIKKREVIVSLKGKIRTVFIVNKLAKKLLSYAKTHKIKSGSIFVTKKQKLINRSNIWRDMKKLCEEANVNPKKVYPHNLRHLFAKTYYSKEKDLAVLADLLGHSNINTTRIYIKTSCNEHKEIVEKMHLLL